MSAKIPLLIDTDPGVDDALALLMAFNDPRHELVGLTIAAGNVGLGHTVANALKLCEVAGVDVPVFAGCATPLVRDAEDAAHVHGIDGFGDIGYPPAARQAEDEHAALAILRLSHVHAGRLLLVALGPLTNLALALRLDPTLPQRVARLVEMGGEPFVVAEDDREAYAEAVDTAASFATAIVDQASGLLDDIGVGRPGAVLAPLVRSAVENALARHDAGPSIDGAGTIDEAGFDRPLGGGA